VITGAESEIQSTKLALYCYDLPDVQSPFSPCPNFRQSEPTGRMYTYMMRQFTRIHKTKSTGFFILYQKNYLPG